MRNEIDYNGQTFTDDTLAEGSGVLIQTESLDGRELAVNTFQFTAESANDLTVFTQNTPAVLRHRGVQRGTVFIQTVEQVQRTFYAVSAFSSLGRLLQREHRGGIYNGVRADVIMADICGGIPFRMDTVFASTLVYGYLPIQQARLSLMQLLFALNANLRTDENGVLLVRNLPTTPQSVLDADKVYRENARVQVLAPITAVTVLEHQFVAQAGTEAETLFEGTTVAGQTITFRDPMFDLVADGFQITESGANYAVVTAGNGTLTGKPYTHITREITKAVTNAPVPNVERIEDATLVGLTASNDVTSRLAEYYRHRTWIYEDVITTFEAPGDVASLLHPYTLQQVLACLASATTVLSTVLKSSIAALVGFTPWQTVAFEDVRVVLTGSGTWTPEEGVTSVTAVLIGKGSTGEPGSDGDAGTGNSLAVTTAQASSGGTWQSRAKSGGKGGSGGAGGAGGKILRVDITIESSTPIAWDTTGDDAIFGSYTSQAGSSSESGYADPITGEVFAACGDSGTPGGDGGSGGEVPSAGNAGGNVGSYAGGSGSNGETRTYSHEVAATGGGGGGGAAEGSNGGNGLLSRWGYGGRGADASQPAAPTTYGKGGHGGHGGGGGGGAGGIYYHRDAVSGGGLIANASGGAKGKGSEGSEGGPACIILTYRRPVTT